MESYKLILICRLFLSASKFWRIIEGRTRQVELQQNWARPVVLTPSIEK